jgi:uncharacterized membrane protein HdeD (DUF308 family)
MRDIWAGVWWAVLLRGLVAIAFGLGALLFPDLTVPTLVLFYAPYVLADGAILIFLSLRDRPVNDCCWAGLANGALSLVAGAAAVFWPGGAVLPLLIIIAARVGIGGVLEIVTAVRLRQEVRDESLLILSGVLSIIVAVLLFANSGTHIVGLASGIGAYAILFGLMLGLLAFSLRSENKQVEEATAQAPPSAIA